MLLAITALLLMALVAPAGALAQRNGGSSGLPGRQRAHVSGCVGQLDNPPGHFTWSGENLIAQRFVTMVLFPCPWAPDANGFISATFEVDELVFRLEGDGSPHFVMHATQEFHALLQINGNYLNCHVKQLLTAEGPLNPALALDDPGQGAQALTGTWSIQRGSYCDGMALRGRGTINWPGGFTFPEYQGTVYLVNQS